MSDFNYKSKGLAQKYVYYNWLDQYHPILKRNITTEFRRIKHQTRNISKVTTQLMSLAANEKNKERRFLRQYFGINVDYDLNDISTIKNFIDGINKVLGLADVYERNKAILQTSNSKNIMSWFPGYFNAAWTQLEQQLPLKEELFRNLNNDLDVEQVANLVIPKRIKQAVTLALKKMIDAGLENSLIDPKLQTAYQELAQAIGNVNTPGLARDFYNIYHLDELKNSLISDFKKTQKNFNTSKHMNNFKVNMNKTIHQKGGLAMEAVRVYLAELSASKNIIVKNTSFSKVQMGSKGFRADSMLLYGIDSDAVQEAFDLSTGKMSHERNVLLFTELGQQLEKIPESFVVYVSNKNYTMGAKFKSRGGFSTGTDITATSYLNLFRGIEKNLDTFVGAMMQLGEGAIGNNEKESFEKIIATNIAYLLFDDYSTISSTSSRGNALHVMDLNGIIMPLSVILSALAQSIQKGEHDSFRQIVDVRIHAPKILFQNIIEENEFIEQSGSNSNHVAWEYQRNYALDNTKIATHFLKTFQEIVREYL